jgi:hypothetical protein
MRVGGADQHGAHTPYIDSQVRRGMDGLSHQGGRLVPETREPSNGPQWQLSLRIRRVKCSCHLKWTYEDFDPNLDRSGGRPADGTRETLYTAVTRAVSHVCVIGSAEALVEAIGRPLAEPPA